MRVRNFLLSITWCFLLTKTIIGQTRYLLNSLPVTPFRSVDKIFQCRRSIDDQNLHLRIDVVSLSVFHCISTQQAIPSTGSLAKLVCK